MILLLLAWWHHRVMTIFRRALPRAAATTARPRFPGGDAPEAPVPLPPSGAGASPGLPRPGDPPRGRAARSGPGRHAAAQPRRDTWVRSRQPWDTAAMPALGTPPVPAVPDPGDGLVPVRLYAPWTTEDGGVKHLGAMCHGYIAARQARRLVSA
jgi:hypothetical protein